MHVRGLRRPTWLIGESQQSVRSVRLQANDTWVGTLPDPDGYDTEIDELLDQPAQ